MVQCGKHELTVCSRTEDIANETQKWGFRGILKSGVVFIGQYLGLYWADFDEI